MFEDIIDLPLLKSQAEAAYPEEAVWLVTEKDGCYQVDNVHEDPFNFFRVSSADSMEATMSGLIAVIHSHCDQAQVPSAADMSLAIKLEVPCGILSTNGEQSTDIHWMTQEIQPLEGRPFAHGTADCYSVVKDYYALNGVNLPEVPRDWQWWEEGHNFLEDLFTPFGFYEVSASEAREGDTWLAQIRGPVYHHCGILLDNDLILHHPGSGEPIDPTKLSIREPVYRYLPYIKKFLRHKDYK
ncbi:MAG TPA: NlpC/P60 family protein [Sphaerochaeta sp.]|nr:NlpC/P60 family protein [Sphaerochaeta sp.]